MVNLKIQGLQGVCKVSKRGKANIVAINNYNSTQCLYKNGKLQFLPKLRSFKNSTIVSCVANKDIITEQIEISPNIPQELVKNVITNKIYDELQFDPTIEYAIVPIKTKIGGNQHKYQTIVVDKKKVKDKFESIAKKQKIIDYAIPAPLLYKVLYQKKILDSSACDLFIYFGEYDSFVTFYYKGEYLYSKSIKYSLNDIYNRFCKLANEVPMTEEKFKEYLAKDGIRRSDSNYSKFLIQIFNECFLSINDILIYTKRAYDIDKVRNAYVALSWDSDNSLNAYVKNYLNLNAQPLTTLIDNNTQKIDPLCPLMILSAQSLKQGSLSLANLTPYPKPKPLTKRPAGKIIGLFLGTSLLFMLPALYDFFVGSSLKANNLLLQKDAQKISDEAHHYKEILNRKKEELKALNQAYDKTETLYKSKVGEVTKVYNKKFHYQFRSEQLAKITRLLQKYNLTSRNIAITDTTYAIELEAKDDKKITAFIKELVEIFDKNIAHVDIKDILYYPKEQLYKGVLKIDFNGDAQ